MIIELDFMYKTGFVKSIFPLIETCSEVTDNMTASAPF